MRQRTGGARANAGMSVPGTAVCWVQFFVLMPCCGQSASLTHCQTRMPEQERPWRCTRGLISLAVGIVAHAYDEPGPHLRIDVVVRPEHRQPWPLGCTRHLRNVARVWL